MSAAYGSGGFPPVRLSTLKSTVSPGSTLNCVENPSMPGIASGYPALWLASS
jgi:hypothetical protein